MSAIRAARREDVPELLGVLCRAFDADPVINWVVRQDGGREAAFRWLFQVAVDLMLPAGHVYCTEDMRGTALWTPPGRRRAGWVREVGQLPGFVRAVGVRRLPRVTRAVAALEAAHPRRQHWYLADLAVDPAAQRRGTGSRLLRHVLERCDREGAAAYLENSNPRNAPLYERHGFRTMSQHRLGGDGPPLGLMWRDPAGPAPPRPSG